MPQFTREKIKVILLRADVMQEDGKSLEQIALEMECSTKQLRHWRAREDEIFLVPGPWQLEHKGKRWKDMPGHDDFTKRCNFALFRRGKFDPEANQSYQPFKRRGRPKKQQEPPEAAPDITPIVPDIAW